MRKHHEESDTFKELSAYREGVHNQFVRTEKALIERKEKLFKANDLAKWGSGPFSCFADPKQMLDLQGHLMRDKAQAFTYMMPKETAECENKKEELCFLTNQCLWEVQRISSDNGRILRHHFKDMSQNMCNYINAVSTIHP